MADLTSPLERDPVIEAYKEHVDRTLLRANLRRTVQERFEMLIELQRLANEVRRAGRAARTIRRVGSARSSRR